MKPQSCFVIGTDTSVGKTLVSCALLQAFAAQNMRVAGMKPVASGCRREGRMLVSEDAEMLLAAGNVPVSIKQINPYAFEPALAPHLAAAMAGTEITLPPILAAFEKLQVQVDLVVVEGVGGFRVPLNDREDTADLARALCLPVVLVVGMRLGCLNHALLTVEAIQQRGLELAGWVANCIDPEMVALKDNLAALNTRLPTACLGVIPYLKNPGIDAVRVALMN
jgi:dethiobiotin synthetase